MTTAYTGGKTWSAGPPPDTFPASDANSYIRDDVKSIAKAPTASVSLSTAHTLTTATWEAIAFDAADTLDTDSFHNPSVNNTRLTIPSGFPGYYLITARAVFTANATGIRMIGYSVNAGGAAPFMRVDAAASGQTDLCFTAVRSLAAADYVEIQCHQTSGGDLDVTTCEAQLVLLHWNV